MVSTLPTHTTNITGFFICCCGLSFLNESTTACFTMSRSNREKGIVLVVMPAPNVKPSYCRCSITGPSASAGTKFSAPTSNTVPISNQTNICVCVAMLPMLAGMRFLAASEPASASTGIISQMRPKNISKPSAVL